MAKKKPRHWPAVCESAEDHSKHLWWPKSWDPRPDGVMYHCRGRDNAEMAEGNRLTRKAVKEANKTGPRKKVTRRLNWRV